MKTVDVKNNLIINDLVKKHFSLTEKSQKLFTQRLLYERPIAKEFQEILKDSKDLRVRFDIDESFMESFDESWRIFRNKFSNYVSRRNLTYNNYSKNKIIVNKNEKKILKDLLSFYAEETKEWLNIPLPAEEQQLYFSYALENIDFSAIYGDFNDYSFLPFVRTRVKEKAEELGVDLEGFFELYIKKDPGITYLTNLLSSKKIFEKRFDEIILYVFKENKEIFEKPLVFFFSEEELEISRKNFEKMILDRVEKEVKQQFDEIIKRKPFANKELELVLTLNYADWFLCSTGDSWSSCISLFSTYDECYWVGIPNLLGDKSRAMVYITEKNGPKKDFYGIKTDKFLIRTWVQLFRTIPHKDGDKDFEGYNKTFFSMVRPYPMELSGLEEKIESLIGIPSYGTIEEKYFLKYKSGAPYYKSRSRYYAENFWFKRDDRGVETMTTIYLDKGSYKLAKKNKAKYFYGDYGYYKFDREGGSSFAFQAGHYNNISPLSQLIASGISFAEIVDDNSTLLKEINRWIEGYNSNYDEDEDDYYEDDYYEDDYDENAM